MGYYSDACSGCNHFGGYGCVIHENDSCEICSEIPTDDAEVCCNGEYTFHDTCIEGVSALPSCCAGCSDIENCTYIGEELKPDVEEEEEEEEEEEDDDDADTAGDADVNADEAAGEEGSGSADDDTTDAATDDEGS
jgi:hypothetical protein